MAKTRRPGLDQEMDTISFNARMGDGFLEILISKFISFATFLFSSKFKVYFYYFPCGSVSKRYVFPKLYVSDLYIARICANIIFMILISLTVSLTFIEQCI